MVQDLGILGRFAFGLCAAGIAALTFPTPGRAEIVQGVVAVVNDEVISQYDLEQRMRLVLSSSGVKSSSEAARRIEPQVLRSLVDEHLQIQEAKQQKITVEEDEVEQALGSIAEQNNMTAKSITEYLATGGIDVNTLKDQIRSEMAWQRLVSQRFGSRVYVSEGEVKSEYDRFTQAMSHPQYLASEIFLPIDNPDQQEEVAQAARGLVADIRRGSPFSTVARQFSKSPSASTGGDLGWVQTGTLDPAVDKALAGLTTGKVSEPLRTAGGYHILYLRNKREGGTQGEGALIRVHLKQLVVPLPVRASEQATEGAGERAAQIASQVSGCASVEKIAASEKGVDSTDMGNLTADQIAPFVQQAVSGIEAGEASRPIRGPMGMHVLIVCSKETGPAPKATMPTMEDVENRMVNQQLSMMSRRYLRDLRRDAVVEYRSQQTF